VKQLPATLTELQQAIASGQVSAQQAWQMQLARRDALDARWHCMSRPFGIAQAQASASGPLAGIALAHKDNFDTWGRRPGCGVDTGHADADAAPAWAIEQLGRAGAGHLGALVMAPYACGATSANPRFERCINPLHPEAVVGGSSSGSAVAVAGGLAYGSLGTDTAGSVRIPAATCGLVGLKTTHGLIPTGGLFPLAPSLDGIGILARTAADARQLLRPLAPALSEPARPQRPRVLAWLPSDWLHPQVAKPLNALAQRLQAEPVSLQEEHTRLSHLADIVLPPACYDAALATRSAQLRRFCLTTLATDGVLMLPALPQPVPDWQSVHVGHSRFVPRELLALHRCMGFINYLGLPSVVLPIGSDERGLPVSVQLVARPFQEHMLLALAEQMQLEAGHAGCAFAPGQLLPATEN